MSQIETSAPAAPELIHDAADLCVKCGLCLPHCPTYGVERHEAESPRGRIALIQGLADGKLTANQSLLQHLDSCLGCRACETACPSGVPYGQLLDITRQWLEPQRPRSPIQRLLRRLGLAVIRQPRQLRRLWRGLWIYQRSGLQRLLRLSGCLRLLGLARLERLLPILPQPRQLSDKPSTAQTGGKGAVALFTGCMDSIFEHTTLQATQTLLQQAGYEVCIPPRQACCGAIHLHNGDSAAARQLALGNQTVFRQRDYTAVVSCASGCAAMLAEYSALLSSTPTDSSDNIQTGPAPSYMETLAFFDQIDWPSAAQLAPLDQTVALLEPCSQRHLTQGHLATRRLLQRIPQLRIQRLDISCCGAAGSQMLSQSDMAERLRQPLLEQLSSSGARLLLSANIGCSLHLRAGIAARQLAIEVIHPVQLLARQYRPPEL